MGKQFADNRGDREEMKWFRIVKNKLWLFWSRFDLYYEKSPEWFLIPTISIYFSRIITNKSGYYESKGKIMFVESEFRFLKIIIVFKVRVG